MFFFHFIKKLDSNLKNNMIIYNKNNYQQRLGIKNIKISTKSEKKRTMYNYKNDKLSLFKLF